MEATPLDIDFEAELRAYHRRRSDRSPGRHLSDILDRICRALEPKRYTGGDIDTLTVHAGFLWEDVAAVALLQHLGYKPKQLEILHDGVYFTLDGYSAKRRRVIETKDTKMSASNPIRSSKFMRWHMQMMAYCWVMGVTECELYVRFVNGSYELAGGRFGKPVMKGWLLRFTRQELRENWTQIVDMNEVMNEEEAA